MRKSPKSENSEADASPSADGNTPRKSVKAGTRAGTAGKKKSGRKRMSIGQKLWIHDSELLAEFPILCGVDEVGRGPLAGNVVAACVILDLSRDPIHRLNDSKQVKEEIREELDLEIKEKAVAWGVGECWPEEIDKFNILRASLLAMRRALDAMASQLPSAPSLILVDGNQYIPDLHLPQRTLVKGDGLSASIAAASILAKVVRDKQMIEMHKLHPEYGFDDHKGYATRAHRSAIEKFGLTPFHRKSFCADDLQMSLFAE